MLEKLFYSENKTPLPELPLAFRLPAERQLRLPSHYTALSTWRFLSHHISRYPQDLRAHTQRILLTQREPELGERLAGSLQDLFIALGVAGGQLKSHLLELSTAQLREEDRQFFQQWLLNPEQPQDPTAWREGSVLTLQQPIPALKLVTVERSQAAASYATIMDEVFACLEYGQIDTARALLETQVLAGNSDELMEQELVNIYQYTRDKDALAKMVSHMHATGREIPVIWLEKQQESLQW